MFTIFDASFSNDYHERKMLLRTNGIALWNVLESCRREGSKDSVIKDEVANNFFRFHFNHPNIDRVFFESKSAANFFAKHCHAIEGIDYSILPSTSGLNSRMSFADKIAAWKVVVR